MKNNNGFSLIEVLVAFGIVIMLIVTVFPITIQITKEQRKLSEQITFTEILYGELQQHIKNSDLVIPIDYNKTMLNHDLYFHFEQENGLLKGCVNWRNVKQKQEKSCLFGFPE
ncbi:type II secretion system protein [Virgibacillus flavescens]|uniref:type II secretion system protein n=1 Tax=Virgibacillus flavescens TaxID=1611422 RepID=UPI003D32E467